MRMSSSVVRVRVAMSALYALLFVVALGGGVVGAAEEVVLLDTNNPQAVEVGPAAPATFHLDRPHVITRIRTYHWNGGRGAPMARMLIDEPDIQVQSGPWEAVGIVPKAAGTALYWECRPNLRLEAGRYALRAADPTTWSQNTASGHRGMCEVYGVPADAPIAEESTPPAIPGTPTPDAVAPSPTTGPIFSTSPPTVVDLTPALAGRPIPAGDGLHVTLPASVVASGGRLTVARATPLRRDVCGSFETFGLFDVSIGDRHEFDDDIVLECPYDPARLDPEMAPEDQVLAARWDPSHGLWVEIPSELDPARGVIVARTRHLSPFGFLYQAKVVVYRAVTGDMTPTVATAHFHLYFDPADLRSRKWLGETSFPPAYHALWTLKHPAWCPLARDIAYYLEASYDAYDRKKLTPLAAVPLRVEIGPGLAGANPAHFEHLSKTLRVSSDMITTSRGALRYKLAHELFHAIQNKDWKGDAAKVTAPATLWWVEATADYAACRVAATLPYMGGGTVNVYPYLLELPLTESGTPKCPYGTPAPGDVEYDKAYFLEYLVERNVDFGALYKAVMKGHLETGRLLAALEGHLASHGPATLPSLFRDYAAYFLFDVGGPRGRVASRSRYARPRTGGRPWPWFPKGMPSPTNSRCGRRTRRRRGRSRRRAVRTGRCPWSACAHRTWIRMPWWKSTAFPMASAWPRLCASPRSRRRARRRASRFRPDRRSS